MATSTQPIHFFFVNVRPVLKNRNKLKKFIGTLIRKEGKSVANVNIVFCSDSYLLKINQEYLRHDFYTDVITFNLSQVPNEISGEVYISIERVRANAKSFHTTFVAELHRIIFHGILHLSGHDDKTQRQRNSMTKRENYYLHLYHKGFT